MRCGESRKPVITGLLYSDCCLWLCSQVLPSSHNRPLKPLRRCEAITEVLSLSHGTITPSPSLFEITLTMEGGESPWLASASSAWQGHGCHSGRQRGRGRRSVQAKWNWTEAHPLGTGDPRAGSAQGSTNGRWRRLPFHGGGSMRWEVERSSTKIYYKIKHCDTKTYFSSPIDMIETQSGQIRQDISRHLVLHLGINLVLLCPNSMYLTESPHIKKLE